jgi:hypothetical protein
MFPSISDQPHASFAAIGGKRLHEVLAFYLPDQAREHPKREPIARSLSAGPGSSDKIEWS